MTSKYWKMNKAKKKRKGKTAKEKAEYKKGFKVGRKERIGTPRPTLLESDAWRRGYQDAMHPRVRKGVKKIFSRKKK